MKFVVALAFLALNFYSYHYLATDPVIPPRTLFEQFPLELGEWACPRKQQIEDDIISNLGVTDYLICNFARGPLRQVVGVYVGYHETQVREEGGGFAGNSIHPPAHCLPGSGWDIIDSRKETLDIPGLPQGPAKVNRLMIAKGESRQIVYYRYQSRGRVVSEDWKKIVYVGWDRATRDRTDGSLVRFTTLIPRRGDEATAEEALRDLAARVIALLPQYVPE